jgi:hypothetical protein
MNTPLWAAAHLPSRGEIMRVTYSNCLSSFERDDDETDLPP